MKVIKKHFDKEAFQKACEEKLRREYNVDMYGRIEAPTSFGVRDALTMRDIADRIRKEVGEENFTKTEEYKLIQAHVDWSNNNSIWLLVTDMNGNNFQLISAEGCQIIEDEKV